MLVKVAPGLKTNRRFRDAYMRRYGNESCVKEAYIGHDELILVLWKLVYAEMTKRMKH